MNWAATPWAMPLKGRRTWLLLERWSGPQSTMKPRMAAWSLARQSSSPAPSGRTWALTAGPRINREQEIDQPGRRLPSGCWFAAPASSVGAAVRDREQYPGESSTARVAGPAGLSGRGANGRADHRQRRPRLLPGDRPVRPACQPSPPVRGLLREAHRRQDLGTDRLQVAGEVSLLRREAPDGPPGRPDRRGRGREAGQPPTERREPRAQSRNHCPVLRGLWPWPG